MAFETANKTIVRRVLEPFSDPSGALVAAKWQRMDIGNGLPATPADIDVDGTQMRGKRSADANAYLIGVSVLNPGTFRVSASVAVPTHDGSASFSPQSYVALFSAVTNAGAGTGAGQMAFCGILTAPAPHTTVKTLRTGYNGFSTNDATLSPTLNFNQYYRVGIEVDMIEDVIRFYLNPTSAPVQAGDETDNAGLVLQRTLTNAQAFIFAPEFLLVGRIAENARPALDPPQYNLTDNILLEEWEVPFTPPQFPQGAVFESLEDAYAVHKTTLTVHALLNNARIA